VRKEDVVQVTYKHGRVTAVDSISV